MRFAAQLEHQRFLVDVTEAGGRFRVKIDEEVWEVEARRPARGISSLLIDGASYVADIIEQDGWFLVDVDGESYRIRMEEEARYITRTRGGGTRQGRGQVLVAPMPGKVVHVAVQVGQAVKAGDGLIVVEAMKMENELKAMAAGTVKEVRVEPGQAINAGDVLVVIE